MGRKEKGDRAVERLIPSLNLPPSLKYHLFHPVFVADQFTEKHFNPQTFQRKGRVGEGKKGISKEGGGVFDQKAISHELN